MKSDWILSDPLGWDELDYVEYLDIDTIADIDTEIDTHIDTRINTHDNVINDKTHVQSVSIQPQPLLSDSIHSDSTYLDAIHLDAINSKTTLDNDIYMSQNPAKSPPFDSQTVEPAQPSPLRMTENEQTASAFDGDTSRANPNFKPLLPHPKHHGETGRQLIMDTETTGLDALKGDRIVEVGIVELINRKPTGEKLHVYINPQRGMDEEVIRIHGITEAFLANQPTFDKVAQKLYDFMLDAEVIAHNASFDMSFLTMEFDKVGLSDFSQRVQVTDSLALAKQQYPGQKNTLDALVRRLNVGKADRTFHGALLDAEILAEVYLAMTGGQVSLAIDEDKKSFGGGAHADFSHLANKVMVAPTHTNEHLCWVAKQVNKHPNVAPTQGIHCFYEVANTDDSKKPLLRTHNLITPPPVNHFNINLFIGSALANPR